jgi:hypothetical protein
MGASQSSGLASAVLRIRDVYPGSRILIFTHPRSRILIFTHPGSRIQKQQHKRGVKKVCCHTFLCSHKFHKIVNYFSFEVLKFQRFIELFTQKLSLSSQKYGIGIRDPRSGIRDPGSGINLPVFRISGPGAKKAPDPGSGSATLGIGLMPIQIRIRNLPRVFHILENKIFLLPVPVYVVLSFS